MVKSNYKIKLRLIYALPGRKERGACALQKTSWCFPGSSLRGDLAQHKTYGQSRKCLSLHYLGLASGSCISIWRWQKFRCLWCWIIALSQTNSCLGSCIKLLDTSGLFVTRMNNDVITANLQRARMTTRIAV